jgi:hypothetical protein
MSGNKGTMTISVFPFFVTSLGQGLPPQFYLTNCLLDILYRHLYIYTAIYYLTSYVTSQNPTPPCR